MSENSELYTTAQVASLTGATLRQLQWWAEQGILLPARIHRHRRMYSAEQIETARKIRVLSDAGIQPRNAKPYLEMDWKTALRACGPVLVGKTLVVPSVLNI